MELSVKAMASGVQVKDADKGLVEAVVGRVGVKDYENELFLPGAFGERAVRVSAYNHRSWPSRGGLPPVGKGRIYEKGDEVRAEIQFFLSTVDGRESFEQVKQMGDLQEWSFGWLPGGEKLAAVSDQQKEAGVRRVYAHVPVAEVSPVLLGASVGTRTTAVKQSDEDRNEIVRAGLQETFGGSGRVWIAAMFSEESAVVYEVWNEDGGEAGYFRVSYELTDGGKVTFGEPAEVRRVTTFEPVRTLTGEALKAEIEAEVAKARGMLERVGSLA